MPRLNIIKILSQTSWGSKTQALIKIYKPLILLKLNYGACIWGNSKNSILKKLNTLHNSGLRLSILAYRSSPIPSILNLTDVPPFKIRRLQLASLLADLDFTPNLPNLSPPLLRENQLAFSDLAPTTHPHTRPGRRVARNFKRGVLFKINSQNYTHQINNFTYTLLYNHIQAHYYFIFKLN